MFVCFCQRGESEKTSVVREGNGGADLCGCGRGVMGEIRVSIVKAIVSSRHYNLSLNIIDIAL